MENIGEAKNEIAIVDKETVENLIYIVRGQKVMLDVDLARIYGYETRRFNEQVKNNSERFDDDFRFQLTKPEFENLMSKNSTSSWGGTRKLPYAFTETGIYMLMTVLKGDLAIAQSKALIRIFKGMKDYISENRALIGTDDIARLAIQTSENTAAIAKITDEMLRKSDLPKIFKNFASSDTGKEFLIMNGQLAEADAAYQGIYAKAKYMQRGRIKVYIYTRVSTAMQTDGYSLAAQKARMKAFADYNEYESVGTYEDAGKSGKSIEGRLEFSRMMEDIKSGKDGVSFVLVFKLSRFGRNAADVLSTLQVMQDFGVNLICVEDGIDSSKDAGKLMISVLSAVAEIERENIRVQTMEGRIQKAREGKWNGGFAPYGYQLIDGKLQINEEEAEAIRVILMNEVEQRQLMEALISEIQIYEDRQSNGQWLKSIKFRLPVLEEDMSLSLEDDKHVSEI